MPLALSQSNTSGVPAEVNTTRSRKRPWTPDIDEDGKEHDQFGESSTGFDSPAEDSPVRLKSRKQLRLSHVAPPGLLYPKSLYIGNNAPLKQIPEREAVPYLLARLNSDEEKYIEISDFVAYRPFSAGHHAGTLAPLSDLQTRQGNRSFLFNGVLTVGSRTCYVVKVPFELVSVEGYDEESVSVADGIYFQSWHLSGSDVWYKIRSPSSEYSRFFENYLWLADFCKHFVCYLLSRDGITLEHFKSRFFRWLKTLYWKDQTFQKWITAYGRTDFRTVVACNYEYLWKESTALGKEEYSHVHKQFLWKEVDPDQLGAVGQQSIKEEKTLVTPYVYDLFKHLYFGDQLVSTSEEIQQTPSTTSSQTIRPAMVCSIKIGDVVCIERDDAGHWKDNAELWYAYVHDIERQEGEGRDILHVFWLYRLSETTCSIGKYPFQNELFFSDHCNCNASKSERIFSEDVKSRLSVTLFSPKAERGATHFIRTTYVTDNHVNHFITLDKAHFRCEHRTGRRASTFLDYSQAGDTVLVRYRDCLEPVIITSFGTGRKSVKVRRLLRRNRDLGCENARPNELVYTEYMETLSINRIVRPCYIRNYSEKAARGGDIPSPYNYNGLGDCWILTCQLSNDTMRPLDPSIAFNQGFDYQARATEELAVLDLFCGSGSFGRGIEQGNGAVTRWAVDIEKHAIHTTRANHTDANKASFYWGSAVDYFKSAISGSASQLIAPKNAVGMITAGSPCQGFSLLQKDKDSTQSRRNASMVALVMAFIDFYRPKYALLENVFGMTRKLGPNKDEDVFAQIVCALVGMGYQVRYYLIDAFSHGSPQGRTRIFISIAAAGLTPVEIPMITHSAPRTAIRSRAIGCTLSGVRFGTREFDETPFPYCSAGQATSDLPGIGEGAVGICIPFPDHRLPRSMGLSKKLITKHIPRYPASQGFVKAVNCIPDALLGTFENRVIATKLTHPKIWSRVNQNECIDTIVTAAKPDDIQNGRWLHWDEHRILTVMEARRAQSFPDDTVLIGLPAQQWKLVGNAVSFYVAAALGLSLRKALEENSKHRRVPQILAQTADCHRTIAVSQVDTRLQMVQVVIPMIQKHRIVPSPHLNGYVNGNDKHGRSTNGLHVAPLTDRARVQMHQPISAPHAGHNGNTDKHSTSISGELKHQERSVAVSRVNSGPSASAKVILLHEAISDSSCDDDQSEDPLTVVNPSISRAYGSSPFKSVFSPFARPALQQPTLHTRVNRKS